MPEHAQPTIVRVCEANALLDGGRGVRFAVARRHAHGAAPLSGFAVRFDGRVYGYLNQCAHVPSELDWLEGQFFDDSGLYLICATHGAMYEPESGLCTLGPCRGSRLRSLDVFEDAGVVYWRSDESFVPPNSNEVHA